MVVQNYPVPLHGQLIIIHLLGLAPAGSWLHRTAARRATYRGGAVKDPLRVTRYQGHAGPLNLLNRQVLVGVTKLGPIPGWFKSW
jgi:hypothetical protein